MKLHLEPDTEGKVMTVAVQDSPVCLHFFTTLSNLKSRLLFWREICIVGLKMMNLARSAALACTFTILILWRKRFRVVKYIQTALILTRFRSHETVSM